MRLCVSAAFQDCCPVPELTGLPDKSLSAVDAGQIPSVQQPGKVGGEKHGDCTCPASGSTDARQKEPAWEFMPSFILSAVEQVFAEYLLCARPFLRIWG